MKLELRGGQLSWEVMYTSRHTLVVVVGGIISGFLCPNRATRRLAIGRGRALEMLLIEKTRFDWRPCILTHLYHEMHQFVYLGGYRLGCIITLL